ncbi:MAG: hypothetical protein WDZ62_02315 [Candidatus Pacearchaeota archaeon]
MNKLMRQFPFATIFALAGFFVGISILFSLDFFTAYDLNLISENPIESLIEYFRESFSQAGKALIKGVILGFVLGSVLGIGGFIIDFLRKNPEPKALSSKKSQKILYER